MKCPILRRISYFISMGVIAAACLPTNAQNVLEPGESDLFVLIVQDNQGQMVEYDLSIAEFNEGGIIIPTVNNKPIEGDPAKFGSPTVLTEGAGFISDVFGVIKDQASGNGYSLAFVSDFDPSGKTIPPDFLDPANPNAAPIMLEEDADGVSVSGYIYLGAGIGQVQSATFTSDVPDGGMTFGLFGIACVGLASRLRRNLT